MPPDPIPHLARIAAKVDASEPVHIEPDGYQTLTAEQLAGIKRGQSVTIDESYAWPDDFPRAYLDAWSDERLDPELDEWRTTYGRLDIPVRLIDWRPIAAGLAALALTAIARERAAVERRARRRNPDDLTKPGDPA